MSVRVGEGRLLRHKSSGSLPSPWTGSLKRSRLKPSYSLADAEYSVK